MTTEQTTSGDTQPRDPDCFEQWLCERMLERRDRNDEVGRVARWVLRENREGRWAPGTILLARYGHAYAVPAHYERVLRDVKNLPEEDVQAFFRVYDLYLKDDGAEYDRMVEERGWELDEEFARTGNAGGGGGDNGGGGGGTATGAEGADADGGEPFSWESWNRFFYRALGPEQTGYELDEDGRPIDEEYRDEGRE
jgi:hypothetical protein